MAAATARSPLYSSQIIDLTQSDDEDLKEVDRLVQAPGFAPQHSLITEAVKFSARERPHERKTDILPWHSSQLLVPASRLETSSQSAAFKSRSGRNTVYRRSAGEASSAGGALLALSSKYENPAKRRKTHGGMIPQHITPVPPPIPQHQRSIARDLNKRHRSPPDQPTMPSVASTIITGASRAESSGVEHRIPHEISIQGPAGDSNTKMEDFLSSQIFKHVKDPLRRYREALPQKVRTSIGLKITEKLVTNPGLYKDFKANRGRLSKEYENNLATRSQAYVDRYAAEALGNGRESQTSSNRAVVQLSSNLKDSSTMSSISNDTRYWTQTSTSPETSPVDDDELFEGHQKPTQSSIPSYSALLRTYSSSPTTSFSNDLTDGEKSEFKSLKKDIKLEPSSLRRSGRLRSSMSKAFVLPPNITKPSKSKPSQVPLQSISSKEDRSQAIKPAVGVVHKIQSLSFAARDKSLPRPYLTHEEREYIRRGLHASHLSKNERHTLESSILHVDFCVEEMKIVFIVINYIKGNSLSRIPLSTDIHRDVISLMVDFESSIPRIQRDLRRSLKHKGGDLGTALLRNRTDAAITGFLRDAAAGRITSTPHLVRLESKSRGSSGPPKSPYAALLRQREVGGILPYRRGKESFRALVTSHLEDSLVRHSEWTDCCGDIATIRWTSNSAFICGATAHSDFHNMQYNKPGNLLVGSSSLDTLKAVGDHRVVRPIVTEGENVENSLESMRQTQDPWLYTSVVSTAHSKFSGLTFTASFDGTVKAWQVSESGSEMDLCCTWLHDGKVNFVVTSEFHDKVATASDVGIDAVRVYSLDEDDIQSSQYDTYCGNRAQEQGLDTRTWAYFPATIQWGKSEGVRNMLLVGYSPRSLTSHEGDIPDDKMNTGELCLWNVDHAARVNISSARTQNVFEVIWHPTQPLFLAATSPCGTFEPAETKTQIRLFAQHESGTFMPIKALDCPAFDINELTLMPNSRIQCYVTASCTDGKTYVWDTAQGDKAIHILQHGDSLDNPLHDVPLELADTGVKFACWGQSVNRFYTGASDGKVKAWDITAPPARAFVRNVLTVTGGISSGAFSDDFTQLVIGDATGKVHLLGTDDSDLDFEATPPARSTPQNMSGRTALAKDGLLSSAVKRPKVVIPHPEPPPPNDFSDGIVVDQTGQELSQIYVGEGHLTVHEDGGIGAVQGPNYFETSLFRLEAHENNDANMPLLPGWQAKQQFDLHRQKEDLRLARLPHSKGSDTAAHEANMSLDFDFARLSLETRAELLRDRVELNWNNDYKFAKPAS